MNVHHIRGSVLVAILALSLGIVSSAGVTPIATLDGDFNVTVNGNPVKASQPAFAGDMMEAPGSALGIIHFPGQGLARVSAEARVSVEQSGKELWLGLQRGYVGIHEGTQPVSVRAHGGKISADSGAVFEVAQVKDATYVTAIKGSAVISEGGLAESQSVAQGQSVKVAFLEPGPLPTASGRPPDSPAGRDPQGAAASSGPTCKDLKATCSKDASTCKAYTQRCPVCNNPCKKGSSSQACKDFRAEEKKCTPLRKACGTDSSKCAEYGNTCKELAGCAGYGGVLEAQAASGALGAGGAVGTAGASAAASSASAAAASAASAAASAGASAAASGAAAAATAGAAAAGSAAVGAATVTASSAAGGSIGTIVSISTSPSGCPAGTVSVRILTGADAGQYDCIVSH
jgi:hypothetical protein